METEENATGKEHLGILEGARGIKGDCPMP